MSGLRGPEAEPRDIIVAYFEGQRIVPEAGVYDHADRIEHLLEHGGWRLERAEDLDTVRDLASDLLARLPEMTAPEIALRGHSVLSRIVDLLGGVVQ